MLLAGSYMSHCHLHVIPHQIHIYHFLQIYTCNLSNDKQPYVSLPHFVLQTLAVDSFWMSESKDEGIIVRYITTITSPWDRCISTKYIIGIRPCYTQCLCFAIAFIMKCICCESIATSSIQQTPSFMT
eukprot:832133_1